MRISASSTYLPSVLVAFDIFFPGLALWLFLAPLHNYEFGNEDGVSTLFAIWEDGEEQSRPCIFSSGSLITLVIVLCRDCAVNRKVNNFGETGGLSSRNIDSRSFLPLLYHKIICLLSFLLTSR